MKIKILTCCAGLKFSYSVGETVDADEATAKDLIQAGHAKAVGGKQGVPTADPPEGAETDGKGNSTAGGGAGKSGGVPVVDAGTADQHGTGADGKQSAKSGT